MVDRPAGPISFDVAAQVGRWVAAHSGARAVGSQEWERLGTQMGLLTEEAEAAVGRFTGLEFSLGPARARLVTRAEWVEAAVASMQRLLRPLSAKLAGRMVGKLAPTVSRYSAGAQLGAVVGWMSSRVLGQYDQLLIEDDRPEDQDVVYYVGPNIVDLERRLGLNPDQFRLWIALHEVTHRAQFTGVPWLRDHFLGLVDGLVDSIDPDPRALVGAISRAVNEIRSGRNPLASHGLIGLVASDEQRARIDQVQALMSLLEGHGDWVMSEAARSRIPDADRFAATLHERRSQPSSFQRFMMQLLGLEAKMRQYEEGERFVRYLDETGGPTLVGSLFDSPDRLPSLAEIRDPQIWLSRVAAPAAS